MFDLFGISTVMGEIPAQEEAKEGVVYLSHGGYYRTMDDADNFRNPVPVKKLDMNCTVMIYRPKPYKYK